MILNRLGFKSCRSTSRRPATLLALLLLPLVASRGLSQESPATERGFKPERAFQVGEIDNIRLLNGGLEISIPIGQRYPVGSAGMTYGLTLSFSGQLWDYSQNFDPVDHQYRTGAYPVRGSSAGFGWRISLGELWPSPGASGPGNCPGCYVSPSGARSRFAAELHPNVPTQPGVAFSVDGTYLRRRDLGSGVFEVDFPSGETHRFDSSGRLVWARDPFGNGYDVQYFADRWEIHDTEDRHHTVNVSAASHYGSAISSVSLETFGGAHASYDLTYATRQVPRSCLDDDFNTSDTIQLPLLTGVSLPDGTSYSIPIEEYYLSQESCSPFGPARQGLPQKVVLPTLGAVEWTFGPYEFPVPVSLIDIDDDPPTWLSAVAGVSERRLRTPSGALEAKWTYAQTLPDGPEAEESITSVTSPIGDRTDYFFTVGKQEGTLYGLSYTPLEAHSVRSDLFLSSRTFDCDTGGQNCVAKRSTYVKYGTDLNDPEVFDANPRVVATLLRYHDDSNRWAALDRSGFDGLGNYRTESTSGTGGTADVRTTFTNYNSTAGTYPGAFTLPASNAPWLLGTYSWIDSTEGGSTARVEFCFDSTGFLSRTRALRDGTSRSNADLLAVFEPSSSGGRQKQSYFGGNLQSISTSSLCTLAPPSTAQFEIRNVFSGGALATSRYYDGGSPWPHYSLDRTIDPSTGYVQSSRDSAGLETAFAYDTSGRLTWSRPESGSDGWTEYIYVPAADSANLAQLKINRRGNGSDTAPVMAALEYYFDGFGRLVKERKRLPGANVWADRETKYSAAGFRSSISEWGNFSKKTTWSDFDPFGRAWTITPPDGAAHATSFTFTGVREIKRRSKVGTLPGEPLGVIETQSETIERFDRQGRLSEVVEPSGSGGVSVTTTYSYDVGNRLRQASTSAVVNGSTVTQNRFWTFDRRGVLTSEQHPELGASGNGTTTYSNFDARGRATRRVDGPNDLTYVFDKAERPQIVRETAGAQRILKEFSYGSTGPNLGKLRVADRYNYVTLSGSPASALVRETYDHQGRGGRVSSRDTEVFINGEAAPSYHWSQGFEYTPLGDQDLVTYPSCISGLCSDAGFTIEVENLYSQGWLSKVQSSSGSLWANISYHSNGAISQVQHRNGVTVSYGADPNAMQRPSSISTSGVAAGNNWSTGPYTFDGSGNIVGIGESRFLYDPVSRIREAALNFAPSFRDTVPTLAQQAAELATIFLDGFESGSAGAWITSTGTESGMQNFEYDAFGNLTRIQGNPDRPISVSASTNRLSGTGNSYDAAGNLISWKRPDGGSNTYSYGPFHETWRVVTVNQEWLHIYTADDERLFSWQVGGAEKVRWTLRDLENRVLREFLYDRPTGTGVVERDNIYRGPGGPLLVAKSKTDEVHLHVDHLGTPRLLTDFAGAKRAFHTYWPYGEEATPPSQDLLRLKFTGHERDLADPGTPGDDHDHMHARMNNPQLGRFLSVDLLGANPHRPQTLNRYAYVSGNPMRKVDPNGLVALEFTIKTFIPATSVTDPLGRVFAGDGRSFNYDSPFYRTIQVLRVETDPGRADNPLRWQFRDVGTTHRLKPDPDFARAPVEGLTASGSRDARGGATLTVVGSADNPLATPSAAIDYSMRISISPSGYDVSILGLQDGFPAMEIYVRNEQGQITPIYLFDPASVKNGLWSLVDGFRDKSIRVNCTGVTSDKGSCSSQLD